MEGFNEAEKELLQAYVKTFSVDLVETMTVFTGQVQNCFKTLKSDPSLAEQVLEAINNALLEDENENLINNTAGLILILGETEVVYSKFDESQKSKIANLIKQHKDNWTTFLRQQELIT